jgi:non-specific protein-tyrosine kinase
VRDSEFDLVRFWQLVGRNLIWLILSALVFGASTYLISRNQTPIFQASARVIAIQNTPLSPGTLSGAIPVSSILDAGAYKEAALSNLVTRKLIPLIPDRSPDFNLEQFKRRSLRVRNAGEGRLSPVLVLNAIHPDPKVATALANAWAGQLILWENTRVRGNFSNYLVSLQAQLRTVDDQIASSRTTDARADLSGLLARKTNLLQDANLIRALEQSASGQISLLDEAAVPIVPVAPRPIRNTAIGVLLGLLLGLAVVLLGETTVRTVRSSDEAQQISGLSVLAEFPRNPRKGLELSLESASYLRTNVAHLLSNDHPQIVAVTSSEPSEGKSSVSATVAKAFARAGKRTLLIDLDLRKPTQHQRFQVFKGSDVVSTLGDVSRRRNVTMLDSMRWLAPAPIENNLHLLPCLRAVEDPAAMLSESFRPFLRQLVDTNAYDVVVVDTAPLLAVSDTLIVAPHVSGVLLVVSEGNTHRRKLKASLDLLRQVGAQALGVVMNNVRHGETLTTVGKYGYGYGYGSPNANRQTKEESPQQREKVRIPRR